MGMYTELVVGCALKHSVPDGVVARLRRLVDDREIIEVPGKGEPRHICVGGSSSFPCVFASLAPCPDFPAVLLLNVRLNCKDKHGEIGAFLAWLRPYVGEGSGPRGLWASTQYEEANEPDFYFLND